MKEKKKTVSSLDYWIYFLKEYKFSYFFILNKQTTIRMLDKLG